jgi:hypothetical protein
MYLQHSSFVARPQQQTFNGRLSITLNFPLDESPLAMRHPFGVHIHCYLAETRFS